MKIVIPGGSGHLGRLLVPTLQEEGHEVVVLSRDGRGGAARAVRWDGRTPGPWVDEVDGADAVVNLAGRSVDCRYSASHLAEMWSSRMDSTAAVGRAVAEAARPPRVWLQASTATIYAHRYDAPNDERTGVLGGHEPDAPASWRLSIEIAQAWERTQEQADTPETRKVALRTAMVMSPEPGEVLDVLRRHVRLGFGAFGDGTQYMSWIHHRDFVRAVLFLLGRDDLDGPVNLAAPEPLPQREFLGALRDAAGCPVSVPVARWMLEAGAFVIRTESELVLKSRRVVPARLLGAGFRFDFPEWPAAARDLVAAVRARRAA